MENQSPQLPQVEVTVDPTLFRAAQQIAPQVRDADILREVFEEAKTFTIGGQEVDRKLVKFIEEYQALTKEPFSVAYFQAKEIYTKDTRDMFAKIDTYVVSKLKEANQNTSPDAYEAFLKKLEKALGLTEHSEIFHRIDQITKFIDNGNKRST